MKIAFILTNYNGQRLTEKFLKSVEMYAPKGIDVQFVVVDNCSDDSLDTIVSSKIEVIKIFLKENLGYFKGLNRGIEAVNTHELDYTVVCNNDMQISPDFFENIGQLKVKGLKQIVYAPRVITREGLDQNPHVENQLSWYRELWFDLLYLNYWLYQLLRLIRPSRPQLSNSTEHVEGEIYQGYGACFLLDKQFFKLFKCLDSRSFLMGEELFLAKQCHSVGYNIYYYPKIVIHHVDNASTSKMVSRTKWQVSRDAHKEYRKLVGIFNSRKL